MPFISGEGGGGGSLPSQWTVDSGGNLAIVATNDNDPALAVTDAEGHVLLQADGENSLDKLQFEDGAIDISRTTAKLIAFGSLQAGGGSYGEAVRLSVRARATGSGGQSSDLVQLKDEGNLLRSGFTNIGDLYTRQLRSGALATVAPVSTTAFQCSTTSDVFLVVPFTGDATNNAATLLIQVSPDNVTFSTLDTLSIAAALNLTGAINVPVSLLVPAAWYVKLTATHGTIGTSTYY